MSAERKFLKSFCSIGKQNIEKYLSLFTLEITKAEDLSECKEQQIMDNCGFDSCFYKKWNDLGSSIDTCSNCENFIPLDSNITEYENSSKETKRLSKSQLLQLIAYHFLPLSSEGAIKYVSDQFISSLINKSVKTINRNNIILQELGLISFEKIEPGIFSMKINNYTDSFNSKEEQGKGFIKLPFNFFEELLSLKTVNHIRLALEAYKIYDSSAYNKPSDYMHQRPLNKFRTIVSKNKAHKKGIFKLLNDMESIFDIALSQKVNSSTDKVGKLISYKLKSSLNGKKLLKAAIDQELTSVMDLVEELKIKVTPKECDDLLSLSMQYGRDALKDGLKDYVNELNYSSIDNLPGFVRTCIESNFASHIGFFGLN